jgi:hypothetical protein
MIAGLFWSRGLLSTSLIAFLFLSVIFYGKQGWKLLKESAWLWGLVILFIIPFISRAWSDDHYQWSRTVQTKIPLLLLPFCVAAFMKISRSTHRWLFFALVIFLCGNNLELWSFFSGNYAVEENLKAKLLPVPMSNDHVRFSWLLLVVYIFLIDEWLGWKLQPRLEEMDTDFAIIYFAIYFHVLAAKTGLVGFYLVSFIALIKYGSKKIVIVVLFCFCVSLYWHGR